MDKKTKNLFIKINPEFHKRIKEFCAKQGIFVGDFVVEAILAKLPKIIK